MSKEYIKAQTPLPAYFPYPKFLLQMSLSHTARLTYVLLLDRVTLWMHWSKSFQPICSLQAGST